MPVLVNEADSSRVLEWASNTFVGRRMVGGLNVDDGPRAREVSSVHAAIFWDRREGRWRIQDLGSANGTMVDGAPVAPGTSATLAINAQLSFGGSKWRLREVEPPPAAARSGEELRLATDELLLLPDEGRPDLVIVREKGEWFSRPYADWQTGGGQRITSGETVLAGGRTWAVTLPGSDDPGTVPASGLLIESALMIDVPPLMENIVPTFERPEGNTTLPARRHHELWWLLARARLADQTAGVDPAMAGWRQCDQLSRELGLNDQNYLNVLVHRSREQVAQAGFIDYASIVERRQGTHPEMRIGLERLTIIER